MSQDIAFNYSQKRIIWGLCAFLAFLSFKPSEPYLSEYLICNEKSQSDYCSGFNDVGNCDMNPPCQWAVTASGEEYCGITACDSVVQDDCGNSDYNYCTKSSNTCVDAKCYKDFSEDQVNDEIYPWSTYAYLPLLLLLGSSAELCSYRAAILVGILGRLITRFLLLYGTSIFDMQWMQITYAFGTAAEDVLSTFVYYLLSPAHYQLGTSCIRATSLATNVVAGVVGDLLVVEGGVSLRALMWISAASVCVGCAVGVIVLRPATTTTTTTTTTTVPSTKPDTDYCSDSGIEQLGNLQLTSTVSGSGECRSSPALPSNSSPTSCINNSSTYTGGAQEKLRVFQEQLHYLTLAFRSKTLTAIVAYWVVGNAVFSTLYDYEVAVYAELNNGSNAWNGSVLAVMLLAGTVGALLPAWLQHDASELVQPNPAVSPGSCEGVDSPIEDSRSSHAMHPHTTVPPTSTHTTKTFATTPEFIVGMRIIIAGALSCVNLLLFVISWEVIASVSFLALFFATWQYINVVVFARIALALKLAQQDSLGANISDTGTEENARNACEDLVVRLILPVEEIAHRRSVSGDGRSSSATFASTSPLPVAHHPNSSTDSSSPHPLLDTHLSAEHIAMQNPLHNSSSSTGAERATLTLASAAAGERSRPVEDNPEPPYSIALVSIIALNVVVQIVLQAVAFSGLALPLRSSCWVFVLTFCAATVALVLYLLLRFGADRLNKGMKSIFSSS